MRRSASSGGMSLTNERLGLSLNMAEDRVDITPRPSADSAPTDDGLRHR